MQQHCYSSYHGSLPRRPASNSKCNLRAPFRGRARHVVRTEAFLGETLKGAVENAALIASAAALTITAVSLLDTRSERVLRKLDKSKPEDEDGQNLKWGVICAISFVPLINWTGWVFAALESESPTLYYAYAALYSLPLFLEGFDIGSFSLGMVFLGALHAQAQRVLVTEPDTRIQLPSGAAVLEPVVSSLQATLRRVPRAVAAAKQLEEGEKSQLEIEYDREETEQQLRSFDEELMQRRKGGQGRNKR